MGGTLDTYSAFRFCSGIADPSGNVFLNDRIPFYYTTGYSDDQLHPVVQGDTLRVLAATYFAPLSYAAELWWVLADYQPSDYGGPIFDPTIALDPSTRTMMVIPSIATVLGVALSDAQALLNDV
jgi:hypothetical protein